MENLVSIKRVQTLVDDNTNKYKRQVYLIKEAHEKLIWLYCDHLQHNEPRSYSQIIDEAIIIYHTLYLRALAEGDNVQK